jgi:Ala-tRNA(Pro) deacylase
MTVEKYLKDHGVEYELVPHKRTLSSWQTMRESHVVGDSLAKAVVLKGDEGYWMAIIPASHHLRIHEVKKLLQRRVGLATEAEIGSLFPDCDIGAVPPMGSAYAMNMVVDDSIDEQQDLFLEGGDHCNLVHMNREQFHKLTENVPHGSISAHG